MKKIFFTGFVFLLSLSVFVPTAQAHVLVTDKHIGAVLHVDPDDDPIAGEQSSFFFEFKDTTNTFKPENCACNFLIDENGREIYAQPLFQNNRNPSLANASIFYTFPQRDVYQIIVTGKPRIENAFQPFTLTYNIRVDRTSESSTAQNSSFLGTHAFSIICLSVILLFFLIYIGYRVVHKRNINKEKK